MTKNIIIKKEGKVKMSQPKILNIQKFSVHDGDGIRTTIFFKGCGLRCWWCHNPESQIYSKQLMFDRERCTGCGLCVSACPNGAISIGEDHKAVTDMTKCTVCGTCFDYCIDENRQSVGKEYEIDDLIKIIKQDLQFYEQSGGGVTLSGGEVMTQDIDYIEELCRRIKKEGINIAIDTCGFAPEENYRRLLPYVDTFLYDIKSLNDEVHKKYMGQSNKLILSNLEFLAQNDANINIRIPTIKTVNADKESMQDIIEYLLKTTGTVRVNLLPYHNTGSSKYDRLGREYLADYLEVPSNEEMEEIQDMFVKAGFKDVKIGG